MPFPLLRFLPMVERIMRLAMKMLAARSAHARLSSSLAQCPYLRSLPPPPTTTPIWFKCSGGIIYYPENRHFKWCAWFQAPLLWCDRLPSTAWWTVSKSCCLNILHLCWCELRYQDRYLFVQWFLNKLHPLFECTSMEYLNEGLLFILLVRFPLQWLYMILFSLIYDALLSWKPHVCNFSCLSLVVWFHLLAVFLPLILFLDWTLTSLNAALPCFCSQQLAADKVFFFSFLAFKITIIVVFYSGVSLNCARCLIAHQTWFCWWSLILFWQSNSQIWQHSWPQSSPGAAHLFLDMLFLIQVSPYL